MSKALEFLRRWQALTAAGAFLVGLFGFAYFLATKVTTINTLQDGRLAEDRSFQTFADELKTLREQRLPELQ